MLADLNMALKKPQELLQRVYDEREPRTLDKIEPAVEAAFASLFTDAIARQQLPCLGASSTASSLPPAGTLVRFRGMVQDTSYGNELFQAVDSQGKLVMYGFESASAEPADSEDYTALRERQVFWAVTPPAETAWYKKSLQDSDIQVEVAKLKLAEDKRDSAFAQKYPLPEEPHFGCALKIYGQLAESLKSTDVREFIGIMGEDIYATGFDGQLETTVDAPTVPAVHVILALPAVEQLESSQEMDAASIRAELLAYLASGLGGDNEAAEWLLLALLTRVHTRHATGLPLGAMSLNLALPAGFQDATVEILSSIVPRLSKMNLSIPVLNDIKTRMAPRSTDAGLDSGALQLPNGTRVIVDMRGITEGKLDDRGVRNLRHLATTMAQQKLSYEFPFSCFELETDLPFVLLSEGKAIIPADCTVYVHPVSNDCQLSSPTADQLERFRAYIAGAREADLNIPEEMTEVIQADFVDRRQKSVGGSGMSQEDLLFRMTVARLMASSMGSLTLTKEAWFKTADLDERRKEKAPVAAKNTSSA
ncbi:hypothetical protein OIV83_001400 [Microbotryomycetes sp. JL201]|nr:hypothetical protein OIV83_001400 [Microbotryomycetes sp. JL201]